MLTDAEKIAARRYCGYPVFGDTAAQAFGHRFSTHYGTLEWKLNHLQAGEEEVLRTTYLTTLAQLESDIPATRENLDTAAAAVWTRNPYERGERAALYRQWRTELCHFLGIPPGPGLKAGGGVSLVV